MRRTSAIVLLLALWLPGLAPLLAWGGDSEAKLPACCRKSGKHHCATMAEVSRGTRASSGAGVSALETKCPVYPRALAVVSYGSAALGNGGAIYREVVSHPAGVAQTEAQARVSASRSNQKRGPPSLFLS